MQLIYLGTWDLFTVRVYCTHKSVFAMHVHTFLLVSKKTSSVTSSFYMVCRSDVDQAQRLDVSMHLKIISKKSQGVASSLALCFILIYNSIARQLGVMLHCYYFSRHFTLFCSSALVFLEIQFHQYSGLEQQSKKAFSDTKSQINFICEFSNNEKFYCTQSGQLALCLESENVFLQIFLR